MSAFGLVGALEQIPRTGEALRSMWVAHRVDTEPGFLAVIVPACGISSGPALKSSQPSASTDAFAVGGRAKGAASIKCSVHDPRRRAATTHFLSTVSISDTTILSRRLMIEINHADDIAGREPDGVFVNR